MIFENCGTYITERLNGLYSLKEWADKKIVISGSGYHARAIGCYFVNNNIDFTMVDDKKCGTKWLDNYVYHLSEIAAGLDENTVIIKSDSALTQLDDTAAQKGCDIVDMSDINIDVIPESIKPPLGYRAISLKETQDELLALTEEFHNFCVKHNLKYYLDSGTLLGAVRHKGFIPWDDDIDVLMPVEDYFRFIELYKPTADTAVLSQFSNDELVWPSQLTKLVRKNIITKRVYTPLRYYSPMGIDIFPLCAFPAETEKQLEFADECINIGEEWRTKIIYDYGTKDLVSERNAMAEKCKEIMLRYDYNSSRHIGIAYFGTFVHSGYGNRALPKEWYASTELMQFEDLKLYAPPAYDSILKKWYGDYMQLPPKDKQKPHNSGTIFKSDF